MYVCNVLPSIVCAGHFYGQLHFRPLLDMRCVWPYGPHGTDGVCFGCIIVCGRDEMLRCSGQNMPRPRWLYALDIVGVTCEAVRISYIGGSSGTPSLLCSDFLHRNA